MAQNIADETQVKQTEQKGKRLRERELDDVRRILETDYGRRFMWRYLGLAGIGRISFTGNRNSTDFNEGQRSIGLNLQADIDQAHPEAYFQMRQEAMKKEREENNA